MSITTDDVAEHYLVSHGKSGGVGRFDAAQPLLLRRGDKVVIESARGREIGVVLCPANIRQARIFGAIFTGTIVRPLNAADETVLRLSQDLQNRLFDESRLLAQTLDLAIEILDVETLFENQAVVYFVGNGEQSLDSFVEKLERKFELEIKLDNLALQKSAEEEGCGKPDCGKGGGGCSSCGSSGGCSSCGATDLKPYFAHLRQEMESAKRTSLV